MRAEFLEQFYEKEVRPRLGEYMQRAEQAFQENKEALREQFVIKFRKICCHIQTIQKGSQWKSGFMQFHLFRSRVLQHDYRYHVMLYGREWYEKDGIPVTDWDAGFFFQYFEALWKELQNEYRKYMGKLTEPDVEIMMLRLLDHFHTYVVELLRYSILDAIETEEYLGLDRGDFFQIRAGEFYEPGQLIHKEQEEKNIFKILRWLEKEEKQAYCFEDFRGLDFSRVDLARRDLRYTDFRKCMLRETNFSLGVLLGAKFRDADLRRADLKISMVAGADFARADLTGAEFQHCVSYAGKKPFNEWKKAGFTETSFRECNLTCTNFEGALLQGVDFSGAMLKETSFRGAHLFQSRFTKDAVENCCFTEQQLEQILVI
ncbi:Pentapeptide repeat-containing protein [Anaeromicropila populeti]|uniref:Pentapeptide repeat-containing protein n=2 Tax=Anaeromicropila populeti TaxID=37658 RepID=A0A1I6HU20_9FIRM|nr:Pentapeptide repeat-containing protein [Anaeromicropila populeti]